MSARKPGPAGRLAAIFIDSKLTPLLVAASVLLGLGAVLLLPREEEPQIVVPMIDVSIPYPGATPAEVEQRVTSPVERVIRQVPGVEYLYSTSAPGGALLVVRFEVGRNEEDAIVRLEQRLRLASKDLPDGAGLPAVRARSIDDVPILALTLSSDRDDPLLLRRIAAELRKTIARVPDVAEVTLIGGTPRKLNVRLDPAKLSVRGVAPTAVAAVLRRENREGPAGSVAEAGRDLTVRTGGFLRSADDAGRLVVAVRNGRPVRLADVAEIVDGAAEPTDYVLSGDRAGLRPAVTISVAKRKGSNAIEVTRAVLERVEELRGKVVPGSVRLEVTRNSGATAAEKSNELLFHMLLAVLSVSLLVALALGWREATVVAVAIPVTLALTLVVFLLLGYTLNRVTLFALIFSIGILVDDAIVVVENVVRHHRLPENRRRPLRDVALEAVAEVGNPTILATFTVVAAILPMGFVRGLMGPYMRPIPIGASAAMLFSLVVAFVVTPWAAVRLLRGAPDHAAEEGRLTLVYRRVMGRILHDGRTRAIFLGGVVAALVASGSLIYVKAVRVKMLPFDDKSELQIVLDLPEGTALETTTAAAREVVAAISDIPEVRSTQIYAGTSAPFNFNGLVRHYDLRAGGNVADVQVNFLPKSERKRQSHEVAKEIRARIGRAGERFAARIKVSEVPPGPPVLQTLVAEIYGPDQKRLIEIGRRVRDVFDRTPGVVDVDSYTEDDAEEVRFVVDRERAAASGVPMEAIDSTIRLALSGVPSGSLHSDDESEDVPIVVDVPRELRSSVDALRDLRVPSDSGRFVPLSAVGEFRREMAAKSIYHKNLMPVVYVTGDVAGAAESPVYAILELERGLDELRLPEGYVLGRHTAAQPPGTEKFAIKWDGEWHVTYEVFRDLGIAFAVVLVLIYALVVGWFQSFRVPIAIMAAIPFSLVGIVPAHAGMQAFFTATSMIGFIAGAGIVVRNSIILVDFIELRLAQGMPLDQAVIDAGAVRFRPMLLTAAAVVVGAGVILFDPIFQGLAISLMAGEVASLLLSRMTVPILYFVLERRRRRPEPAESVKAGPAEPAVV